MNLIPRRLRRDLDVPDTGATAPDPSATDYLHDILGTLEEIRDGISGPDGITAVVHEDLAAIRKDMAKTQANTAAIAIAMKQIAKALAPPD